MQFGLQARTDKLANKINAFTNFRFFDVSITNQIITLTLKKLGGELVMLPNPKHKCLMLLEAKIARL